MKEESITPNIKDDIYIIYAYGWKLNGQNLYENICGLKKYKKFLCGCKDVNKKQPAYWRDYCWCVGNNEIIQCLLPYNNHIIIQDVEGYYYLIN